MKSVFISGVSSGRWQVISILLLSALAACESIDPPPPIVGTSRSVPARPGEPTSAAAPGSSAAAVEIPVPAAGSGIGDGGGRYVSVLYNPTALPGDNILVVEPARGSFGSNSLASKLDGLPTSLDPFGPMAAWDFTTKADGAGSFDVVTAHPGSGVTCVAAVRVVDAAIPAADDISGPKSMALRNCIKGSAEKALEPIILDPLL